MSSHHEAVARSATSVTKLVFPHNTNHHGALYGGTALSWMDEVAYIAATRFSRQKMVTVSMDRIDFNKAIPEGTIVELVAQVTRVGHTSVTVQVEVFKEAMFAEGRELAVSGHLVFVALGDDRRPVPLSVHGSVDSTSTAGEG